jgi:hypothetical protein
MPPRIVRGQGSVANPEVLPSWFLCSRGNEALRYSSGLGSGPESRESSGGAELRACGHRAEEALRLSPRDVRVTNWFLHANAANAFLGDFEAAAVWYRKSIDANRSNPWAYFYLAACLAQLGRLDEAVHEMKSGLVVSPKFTITRCRASLPSSNAVCVAQHERVIEGMRKAGCRRDEARRSHPANSSSSAFASLRSSVSNPSVNQP